jgi:prepilin-type N-terminal cleavage/methylation domain-containing protein
MLNKKFEGFTLTEAMMAVVILGFACSAVLFFQSKGSSKQELKTILMYRWN